MKATAILEAFLGSKSREDIDMRRMLFANRFKYETSVKRFARGVRTLTEIECVERLERLGAQCVTKWEVTHILGIVMFYIKKMREIVEYKTRNKALGYVQSVL